MATATAAAPLPETEAGALPVLEELVVLGSRRPEPLRQVFANILINASDALRDRGTITITTECEPGLSAHVNRSLATQALANLVSNAIKYSPDGGAVTLRVKPVQATKLLIEVSDHGIGIPPAYQPNLFECFHRASNVGNIAGTGLGLSIVRDAVECHRGTISLHSAAGQGSCFTVMLEAPPADTGNT